MKRIIGIIVALVVVVAVAFGLMHRNDQSDGRAADGRLNVVSSFSIINQISEEIGGKYVNAHTITAIGADQHDYDPTPTDVKRTQDAAIVFANGLNLEKGGSGWFDKLMKTTDKHAGKEIFNVTDGIKTIKLTTAGVAGQDNPHAWNGVLEGKTYAANIAKVLEKKDPAHKAYYAKRATAYEAKLQKLYDKWHAKFAALPADDKKLVTQEGAMAYFARDFGLKPYFIWEIDTESNGTPSQIRTLVEALQGEKVRATFVEQGESDKPMQTVISQINSHIAGELWTDSVSKKSGVVPTYYDLLNHNAQTIYDGLTSK
ncbi:metal ABC transporter substrate-binding protein [Weissella cibaria]|jgi:ABC-type metal ion transport system, periplasmic component/surface adhesin|uniref:Metal ABC transporter substrate-binding protein n=1 Tax=Weissella cibaria TaxID=137591 RepID=A0A1X4JNK3_9LACO|nr:zinc ABC transporter substrate-binding protein [Weissella cibaria]MBZ6070586.1 zinc ABC transporter substrate-binding protein [Weissella cibaria]MCA1356514.1 zinc ABC transporter substrate-binding protein [Weissella cibaria]MCS9988725.1 metal ABC transporter substrate-binding protein [Weissella cibaria]MCT0958310.1 metal ABC transporter substrate-binding protein [Weissella cibaria]MCT8399618.1 metal ABC transporter substrate-binding protein [Weissella cibaria]